MSNQFSQRIKMMQRETTELKTVKRLSTKTLKTQMKSITTWGTVRRQNQQIFTGKAAFVDFGTDNPAPFMITLTNEEHRNYRIFNYENGVIVAPAYTPDLDQGMNDGDKTVNFTVHVTTTNNVNLTATQMEMGS